MRERVASAFAALREPEPWDITRLGVAAYHVDILSQYRPLLQRALDRESETGAMATSMTMLHQIMLDQMAVGEWDEAERTGQRCLDLATARHHMLFAHHARGYLGLLAAMRGQSDRARRFQATVDAWARPRGVGFLTQIADAIGTTTALSEGDYEAAYLHAIGITRPGSFTPYAHQAPHPPRPRRSGPPHRPPRTSPRPRPGRPTGPAPPHLPRLAVLTHGALAMTATDPGEAAHHYHQAETHPAAAALPYELARIRLAHGIHLRHTQGRKSARLTLTLATDTFERLGAPPGPNAAGPNYGPPERPARLLGAPGDPDLAGTPDSGPRRGGLTNKEIGARMHLSPRTVSSHLYRVFPKLGITSRAALRDALGKLPDGQDT
ncbi:helix-turn-helix transcriptional regulator [Streptomyces nogalater]